MSFGARFLMTDRQTLVSSGAAWGDTNRHIHLPFGTCHFLQLTPSQHRGLHALDVNRISLRDAHVHIHVCSVDSGAFRTIDWRGREYALEFEYRPDRICWAGDGFLAELETNGGHAVCHLWTVVSDTKHFAGIAQNLLRVIAAYRLLETGGLLLHSAGVGVGSSAVLFFGTSGAGKSTVAASALEQGHAVFSDDLNAVIPLEDGYAIAAVPFTGDLDKSTASQQQLSVSALYRIGA